MNADSMAVGVLAGSNKQLGELNRLIRGAGYRIEASIELRDSELPVLPSVDVWVVNLDLNDERCLRAMDQLEALEVPVIFEEDVDGCAVSAGVNNSAPTASTTEMRISRERRVVCKLRQLVREPQGAVRELRRAHHLWVLGASTGGPDAVSEFLRGIPDDIEGVALLYAQHIEVAALNNLRDVMQKHSRWAVTLIEQPQVIRERTVYVLSPAYQVEVSDSGVLAPSQESWSGFYKPSINQVIARVARVYRSRCGVIVFSGMGDDGAQSCAMMHHRGGQVWVQSIDSCTIDSMPASVLNKGLAQLQAPPAELAERFVELYRGPVRERA